MNPARLLPIVLLAGCSTMTGARPLSPGQHAAGATLGGGMVQAFGAPIPLPNVVAEGRHGLGTVGDQPFDLHYGINLTGLAFGLTQIHVGTSAQLTSQKGAVPAFAVTKRLWTANNALGGSLRATDPIFQMWVASQLEVHASWEFGEHLTYVSVSEYLDWFNPSLTLTPAVGAVFDPGEDAGFYVSTELRWFGINQPHELDTVSWVPGKVGTLGVHLGVGVRFGREE